jgi:glutathione synthase/RimK-type ligase-like ATP-grasp enzyme
MLNLQQNYVKNIKRNDVVIMNIGQAVLNDSLESQFQRARS